MLNSDHSLFMYSIYIFGVYFRFVWPGYLWIYIVQPNSASDCLLQSCISKIYMCVVILRDFFPHIDVFRVYTACDISLSHSFNKIFIYITHKIEIKWSYHVYIEFSALFLLCIWWGISSYSIHSLLILALFQRLSYIAFVRSCPSVCLSVSHCVCRENIFFYKFSKNKLKYKTCVFPWN